MKRTTPMRRVPFKRPDHLIQRQRGLLKVGKKGHKNKRANAILARDFRGERTCEARLEGCWGNVALSWSHWAKRRKLTPEQLTEAALMCTPCHQKWEVLPPAELEAKIKGLIAKRETRFEEAA